MQFALLGVAGLHYAIKSRQEPPTNREMISRCPPGLICPLDEPRDAEGLQVAKFSTGHPCRMRMILRRPLLRNQKMLKTKGILLKSKPGTPFAKDYETRIYHRSNRTKNLKYESAANQGELEHF